MVDLINWVHLSEWCLICETSLESRFQTDSEGFF